VVHRFASGGASLFLDRINRIDMIYRIFSDESFQMLAGVRSLKA